MLIKVKKTWKDLRDNKPRHEGTDRRTFLSRGLATVAFGVALPDIFLTDFANKAQAAALVCPPPTLTPGAIGQIFSNGGSSIGSRFISEAQAASAAVSKTMANNYGITGANLVKLGPNLVIDGTSAFGFTLLQGPPGYTGGPTAWQANVLNKLSGGGHLGPMNQDDGAGENTGLVGDIGLFKASQMGADLKLGVNVTLAKWANGLSAHTLSRSPTPAALAATFSLTPAATGLTNAGALQNATDASNALANAMDPVLGITARIGGSQLLTSAGCGFTNNVPLANPTYGSTLFTPTNIAALTSKMTVANLTTAEQAYLAAFYQSAMGVAGGVIIQNNGMDYHGTSPANTIAPADIAEARQVVMFLAACDAAQARGAFIYTTNGQAISSGVQSVATTINGAAVNVNAPVAQDDAGGAYNGGLIIFYDPKGAPPVAQFTGTVNATDGSVKVDPTVGSSQEAMAGLYLSALKWINNGTLPQSALTAMNAAGVAGATARTKTVLI